MAKEQRRTPRVSTRLTALVTARANDKVYRALTADVGAGGLRVVLDDPLERGTVLELDIKLPDRSEPIVCQGVVIWGRPVAEGHGQAVDTGIQFISIEPKDRTALVHYAKLIPLPPSSPSA